MACSPAPPSTAPDFDKSGPNFFWWDRNPIYLGQICFFVPKYVVGVCVCDTMNATLPNMIDS